MCEVFCDKLPTLAIMLLGCHGNARKSGEIM